MNIEERFQHYLETDDDTDLITDESIDYLKTKIDENSTNPKILVLTSYFYKNHLNNIPKAIQILQKAVDLDDPHAMNSLAFLYEELDNTHMAIIMYEKAIANNYMAAMANLGHIYHLNKEYINIPKAIELYKLVISKNKINGPFFLAINNLARIYSTIPEFLNIPEAIRLYKISIEGKNPSAMFNLACFYNKNNEYQNIPEAIKLFEMAIEFDHEKSINNLAILYCKNQKYMNVNKAVELCIKGMKLGYQSTHELACKIFRDYDDLRITEIQKEVFIDFFGNEFYEQYFEGKL